ncbi:MAG: HNH endonuclease [Bacteroidetes bacterium]|nr:HNH endonuclease [Bacteroidota bacterium]
MFQRKTENLHANSQSNNRSAETAHGGASLPAVSLMQCKDDKAADISMQSGYLSNPVQAVFSSAVIQQKTDVRENKEDGNSSETSSKKIQTPTQGLKWFRFAKSGDAINSFSSNIYPGSIDKGTNPVRASVEIGAQAVKNGLSKDDVPDMSRAKHFALGDEAASISKSSRKGTWTWHHQDAKYNMELVDMHVHGGFGHTGGFSKWQEDDNDED